MATTKSNFTIGTEEYWLDNVQCSGEEDSLLECPSNPWKDNDCGVVREVAGVICFINNSGKNKGNTIWNQGQVITFLNNTCCFHDVVKSMTFHHFAERNSLFHRNCIRVIKRRLCKIFRLKKRECNIYRSNWKYQSVP